MPSIRRLAPLAAALFALTFACATTAPTPGPQGASAGAERPAPAGDRTFAILAVNDVYRIEGIDGGTRGHLARLRTLRQRLEQQHPDLLLLHAGDALYPSFASRTFDGGQMIDVLNLMDGDGAAFDDRFFATLGNHEFDAHDLEDAALLDDRIEESAFWWFATNVEFESDDTGLPLVAGHNLLTRTLVDTGGVRVGLFGLTIDNKKPAYVRSFGDYEATAREQIAALREAGAEFVVALTHLDLQQDAELLFALQEDGPDLVIGGHDHNQTAREVDGRWILK
ncbi:MAG TPA: metallophosphoesterase, partial [Thermoanaerobaculia bacterium]|nr:metallophosphoesterase [Thermoanaerobaculia bacterium]